MMSNAQHIQGLTQIQETPQIPVSQNQQQIKATPQQIPISQQMQRPQQASTNSQQILDAQHMQGPQQIQASHQISGSQLLQGVVSDENYASLQRMQVAVGPGGPLSQQEQSDQKQPMPTVPKVEEERKSPEIAELISFD